MSAPHEFKSIMAELDVAPPVDPGVCLRDQHYLSCGQPNWLTDDPHDVWTCDLLDRVNDPHPSWSERLLNWINNFMRY
jgi:hypothetical protein